MIEFRYIKTGNAYMPQYKQAEFENEWRYFTEKTLGEKTLIRRLAAGLAELNIITQSRFESRWDSVKSGPYFIMTDNKQVYFLEEHLVCAFLGGAKSYYSKEIKEFDS